tara:strand:+ start:5524 stop:7719 length:2196 start_codon:yes stop_codon:yes gene_type:complete
MALKVGEKEVGTSIASLSQRRGVTPAYTGDALATAADNIGKVVNTFQARAAELLDLEYRTKANVDATNYLTTLSRDENYRYDPDKFMAAANAYMEKSIEQAPLRYKSWTKQLISPLIATKGDALWTKWNNRNQAEKQKIFQDGHTVIMNDIATQMQDMNFAQLDEFIVGPDGEGGMALQKLGESYELYTKLYNSLDDNSNLLRPEEWFRNQQIFIEEARMESIVTSFLKDALIADADSYLNDPMNLGFEKDDLQFENAAKYVKTILKKYQENPEKIEEIPAFASLLKDTTIPERELIVTNLQEKIKSYQNDSDKEFEKYKVKQQINAESLVADVHQRLDGFDSKMLLEQDNNELVTFLQQLNLSQADITNILHKKKSNTLIWEESKNYLAKPEMSNMHNMSITIMNKLKAEGWTTYENAEQVKQAMVDSLFNQQLRPHETVTYRTEIAPQLGYGETQEGMKHTPFFNANTIDFFEYDESGRLKYPDALNTINELVSVTNRVPTAVLDAFGQQEYLQIKSPLDFQRTLELGKLAMNIIDKDIPPSNLDENSIIELKAWSNFYKEYQSINIPDDKAFKDVRDDLEGVLIASLSPTGENFYSSSNYWVDANLSFDANITEDGQINVAQLFKHYVKDNIDTMPVNTLIPFWGELFKKELSDSDLDAIANIVEVPFKALLAEDIYLHYTNRKVDPNNVKPGELLVPNSFLNENYLLKVFTQAMQMKDIKEWTLLND